MAGPFRKPGNRLSEAGEGGHIQASAVAREVAASGKTPALVALRGRQTRRMGAGRSNASARPAAAAGAPRARLSLAGPVLAVFREPLRAGIVALVARADQVPVRGAHVRALRAAGRSTPDARIGGDANP